MATALETRIARERTMVRELFRRIIKAGHMVNVVDSESSGNFNLNPYRNYSDMELFLEDATCMDEVELSVIDKAGKAVGYVFLVYGNDGYDVIADYSARDGFDAMIPQMNEETGEIIA